ncbi:MAG: hypothetical protein IJJ96_00205 [Bacteroidales bacterium]|nr:hypothetical protein [Bacteroidales bacterium]
MENNEIAKALGQVPELVARTDTLIEDNARKDEIIGRLLQSRMKAEIPDSEVEKVVHAASTAVARTRCATPDAVGIGSEVASFIKEDIRDSLHDVVVNTVRESIKDIPVEHIHTHTTLRQLTKMAEEKLNNWIEGLAIACASLFIMMISLFLGYINSEEYLGSRYVNVINSKYITTDETKALMKGTYYVGIMPKEYSKNRRIIRQRIRRNEEILRQRRKEARANKGNYSTTIPLER